MITQNGNNQLILMMKERLPFMGFGLPTMNTQHLQPNSNYATVIQKTAVQKNQWTLTYLEVLNF